MNQHPPPNTPTAWAPSSGPTASVQPQYSSAYDPRAAEIARLESDTRTWLIVAAVGWLVGFMWVLGPLAWFQATRIRDRYHALGAQPPGDVGTLRLVGIITTVFSVFLVLAVMGAIFFSVLVAVGMHQR